MKGISIAFTVFLSLITYFNTPCWSAQEGGAKSGDKIGKIEREVDERAPEEKAVSEVDRLAHEWRVAQLDFRFKESIFVCGLAVVCLTTVLLFMTRRNSKTSGAEIINVSGLVFIVFGTILLVVVADLSEQVTSSIGVLGAIAGYLFGRSSAARASGTTASGGEGAQPEG